MQRYLFLYLCMPLWALAYANQKPIFYQELAQRIWRNESGCSVEKLVWWNEGESFMSVGIGHFLWFPKNTRAPFTQTFPELINFMKRQGQTIPAWLEATKEYCPWTSRQQVINGTDRRLQELRTFLYDTRALQAKFIVHRFEQSCQRLIRTTPHAQRRLIQYRIDQLAETPQGLYALIDYVNFKGDGTNKQERYHNQGWGLLQVLTHIDAPLFEKNPRQAFVTSAQKLLTQRVENASIERHEQRWLPGWINRLRTYC